jgi:hypothetical protein
MDIRININSQEVMQEGLKEVIASIKEKYLFNFKI